MIIVSSHQVPMILFGPTIRTVIPCGYHQLSATWPDIADSTGSIMIMDILFERIEGAHFILGAVYGSSSFKSVSVFSIFGLVWQTEVITSSSCVAVMAACYEPWVAHQKKKKGVAIRRLHCTHKLNGPRAQVSPICCYWLSQLWLRNLLEANNLWTAKMSLIYCLMIVFYCLLALSRCILRFKVF